MIGGFFMGKRNGTKHYPNEFKQLVVVEHYQNGKSISMIIKEYGISKSNFCRWCEDYRKGGAESIGSKSKGRPRKAYKLEQKPEERIKQLEMEVELLKAFLCEAGRRNVKD